jgi:GT2 family glycosyltransferase
MKLSIVIINWNDKEVLRGCLQSIFKETREIEFEVIISDNGSKDDTLDFVRQNYPQAVIVENKANLGFARGNNSGIAVAKGEYILILNPDTIILDRAFDKWIPWADRHPEAGVFGCMVLNPDRTLQESARPFPSIKRYWIAALYLRSLAFLSPIFYSDTYTGWKGMSEREIDWQSGCCILFRASALREVHGFDARFFYHYEEVDLCFRIYKAGYKILYTPDVWIIHLGGQSVKRQPLRFLLETYRSRYKYFHKHYGLAGAKRCKTVTCTDLWIRRLGYGVLSAVSRNTDFKRRIELYKVAIRWNSELILEKFISSGEEPEMRLDALEVTNQERG